MHQVISGLNFALLFCALGAIAEAQTITDVTLEVFDREAKISYVLTGTPGKSYEIEVFISSDGGTTFFKPHTIRGAVGVVSEQGHLFAIWDVIADVENFLAENCVAKVKATEFETPGEALSRIFTGSERMKENVNGIALLAGVEETDFLSDTYKSQVDAGNISANLGYWGGIRYTLLPFMVSAQVKGQDFDVRVSTSTSVTAQELGIDAEASIFVLPLTQFFLPSVGGGYRFATLSLNPEGGSKTVVSTSALYVEIGTTMQLSNSIGISGILRRSVGITTRAWQEWSIALFYHPANHK